MEDRIWQHDSRRPLPRATVVVVGRDAALREAVARALRGAGHVVHDHPSDGDGDGEAQDACTLSSRPDLVVETCAQPLPDGREPLSLPPSLARLPRLVLGDLAGAMVDAGTAKRTSLLRHVELLAMAAEAADPPRPGRVVDVGAVLQESLRLASDELDACAHVVCEFDSQLRVVGDPEHLCLIFRSLLRAAAARIEPGSPGTHGVRVAGWRTLEGSTIVEISDTGQRIEPDQLVSLFDAAERSTSDATELDLATSRRIVHAGGGAMTVSSGAGGTRFRVALPTAGSSA